MKKITGFFLVLGVSICFFGCQASPSISTPVSYAPIQPSPKWEIEEFKELEESKEVPKKVLLTKKQITENQKRVQIFIEARFISGPVAEMKKLGFQLEKAFSVISEEEMQKRFTGVQAHPKMQTLTAPRLTILDDQKVEVRIETQSAYIAHGEITPDGINPIIDYVPTGTFLNIRAHMKGDKVVLTELSPLSIHLLAMRYCRAKIQTDTKEELFEWGEPIVCMARSQVKDVTKLPLLAEEEYLVLPLAYSVEHARASTLRLLAKDGVVKERMENQHKRRGAPASNLTVLMIKARKVSPQISKR